MRRDAGSILFSSAAWIVCCHVLVELGMTKPNWKFHSSMQPPWKKIFCSRRRPCSISFDENWNSRETALHCSIALGRWTARAAPGARR